MARKGVTVVAHIKDVQGALVDYWDWQALGSCNTMDPEFFFHPEGERGGPRRRRIERAKRICQTCPVLDQCREYALTHNEPYGVWGGLSEEERNRLARERRRSRAS
ncbi:WhiB family transcriptional regulator [Trueperella pecoris]|uniref:WhiB family transcriptional regulator n=1 Tax=Trueperella pecoris TaxID=2733571 RepID=UPI00186B960C|nr:WhiB family transcriptional regulator [Trueperella pecoris]QOQ39832.1 WhiB family transcriptional regulator [Trueperella pecoris]